MSRETNQPENGFYKLQEKYFLNKNKNNQIIRFKFREREDWGETEGDLIIYHLNLDTFVLEKL